MIKETIIVIGIVSTLVMLFSKSVVYAVIALATYTIVSGIILVTIGASFLGFTLIIVYAGAIIIFFMFILMMLDIKEHKNGPILKTIIKNPVLTGLSIIFLIGLNIVLYDIFNKRNKMLELSVKNPKFLLHYTNSLKNFETLYTDNFIYIILAGLLLLLAITAAIILTNTKRRKTKNLVIHKTFMHNNKKTLTISWLKKNKNLEKKKIE